MLEGKREGAAEGFSRGFCCCRREVELWWGAVRVGAGRFNMCFETALAVACVSSASLCLHRRLRSSRVRCAGRPGIHHSTHPSTNSTPATLARASRYRLPPTLCTKRAFRLDVPRRPSPPSLAFPSCPGPLPPPSPDLVPSCAPCPSPVAVHTTLLLYFYFLSPHLHLSLPPPHYTPHYTHYTLERSP